MDVERALREAAPAVFDGAPVLFAYLHGSHATGAAGPRSDVDVAVYLDPQAEVDAWALSLRLAGELERASGVGPIEAVVVLNEAPLGLAGRIRDTGTCIYSRDDVARVRWASLTARMYHDYMIREERFARERLRNMAAGST
jgi:uncharacterized protein